MSRNAIIAQLSRHGMSARPSGNDEIRVCCPFCPDRGRSPDDEYALGVNVHTGIGHCFRCGWRSGFALDKLKVERREFSFEDPKTETPPPRLPEDFTLLQEDDSDEWMTIAWRYVTNPPSKKGRGISEIQVRNKRLGLSMTGKFAYRVIFPIYRNEKLLGFTGRTILKDGFPKWKHSEGLNAMYPARISKTADTVVLTEGVVDALAVARNLSVLDIGWKICPDSIALLGTGLPAEKMEWIERYQEIVLWMDPDRAGKKFTADIGERLSETFQVMVVRPDRKCDPSDLSQMESLKLYHSRERWTSMLALEFLGETI